MSARIVAGGALELRRREGRQVGVGWGGGGGGGGWWWCGEGTDRLTTACNV